MMESKYSSFLKSCHEFWQNNNFDDVVSSLKIDSTHKSNDLKPAFYFSGQLNEQIKNDIPKIINEANDSTYHDYLNHLIYEKNLKSSDICKWSGISDAQFSKISIGINNGKNFIPKRKWLLRIAIAMKLSLDEVSTLLKKAGYAFNDCKFDKTCIYIFKIKAYDDNGIDTMMDIHMIFKLAGVPSLYDYGD